MKIPLLFLTAALLLLTTSAFGQDVLPEGTRVRVKVEGRPPLIATLRTISADSIWLIDTGGQHRTLARQNAELERSLGKHTRFWHHFGVSIMVTALGGGLLSALTFDECDQCIVAPDSRGEAFVWGFVAGGAIGVPVGALMGALAKVERWEQVRD
ncbi:MAG TPA: hypothetical protein VGD27_02730 [Longimicrobiales bacterium]